MKIPRETSGKKLAKLLESYGYETIRQTGSHIRLRKREEPEHYVTIPNHNPIKIGTLSNILTEVANHLEIPKDRFVKELFGSK